MSADLPMDSLQIQKMVQDEVRTAIGKHRIQVDRSLDTHGSGENISIRRRDDIPVQPVPPFYLLGGGSSESLWNVTWGPKSGGGYQWQLKIKEAFIFNSPDLSQQMAISNLNTNVNMNTTVGDWLYIEIPTFTGSDYPSFGTLTVKAAGGVNLPGGGVLEYEQSTVSGATVNTQTFLRIPLAKCTVASGAFTVSPPLQSKIIWLVGVGGIMYDSGFSNSIYVGGLLSP